MIVATVGDHNLIPAPWTLLHLQTEANRMGSGASHSQKAHHHHHIHHAHVGHPIHHAHPHWTPEQEFFAFQVFHHDMEHGTLAEERNMHVDEASEKLSDEDFYLRVEELFLQAVQEKDLPILECKSPAVIGYKYSKLTDEEKTEIQQELLDAAMAQDKKQHAAAVKANAPQDYSKSFGGTAADTKNEIEAAGIIRGESSKNAEVASILQPPSMPHPSQHHALKRLGKWTKFLSNSGCYVYFHPITRDLLAIKPEDYVEEVVVNAVEGEGKDAEVDPANGLPKIKLTELPAEIDRIVKELKKTPLIIDNSPTEVVRTYYSYKAHLEDVSCLTIPFGKSGLKREDVMERCRKRLVAAMKSGQAFVFFCGGLTIEHADLKTKLCKKDCFPKDTFVHAGAKLLEPHDDPKYKLFYHEEDLEAGQAVAREGFHTIVVTTLSPFEYEKQLEDTLPLGYMYPIYVTSDS